MATILAFMLHWFPVLTKVSHRRGCPQNASQKMPPETSITWYLEAVVLVVLFPIVELCRPCEDGLVLQHPSARFRDCWQERCWKPSQKKERKKERKKESAHPIYVQRNLPEDTHKNVTTKTRGSWIHPPGSETPGPRHHGLLLQGSRGVLTGA